MNSNPFVPYLNRYTTASPDHEAAFDEFIGQAPPPGGALLRLAQRARNVGIHLVIATQRPSAAIVTTSLKTNLPARVAFRLPAHHDLRSARGAGGGGGGRADLEKAVEGVE